MGKIYGENLRGKFTGKIYGENLRGKFTEKIYGENLRRTFTGKIYGENLQGKFKGKFHGKTKVKSTFLLIPLKITIFVQGNIDGIKRNVLFTFVLP
jgi:hypothetical protein